MFFEIVVRAVGYAPKLAPTEGEQILEVARRFGIERKLGFVVVAYAQALLVKPERKQKVVAVFFPILEPLEILAGFAEKLHFHLLEFAHAENKVAGGYLVAERLADLAHAERYARSARTHHVFEVYEYTLCGLGAQIARRQRIFRNALEGFEHELKLFNGRKIGLAANGAGYFMLGNECGKRVVIHGGYGHVEFVLVRIRLDEIVGTAAALARLTVHERIGKAREMSRRFPNFRIHEYGAVQSEVVFALGDELLPPCFFDVVVQLHADRTVVPSVGKPAVNIASRENQPARLAQRNQLIHCYFHTRRPFRCNIRIL